MQATMRTPPDTGESGSPSIALKLAALEDLLDPYDPATPSERALSEAMETRIAARASRLDGEDRLRFVLHLPIDARTGLHAGAFDPGQSIARHFERRRCEISNDTAESMRRGWRYLAVGMAILTVCMVLGYLGRTYIFPEPYGTFIEQALSVFGWVANWRPAEILLYERLNARARLALYQRIAAAEVVIAGWNPN